MKTAISIPDPVYKSADELARSLGKSRSELYTQALVAYLKKHQSHRITQQLDDIYGKDDSALDAELAQAQAASIAEDNTW